jgi:hypothetical protein
MPVLCVYSFTKNTPAGSEAEIQKETLGLGRPGAVVVVLQHAKVFPVEAHTWALSGAYGSTEEEAQMPGLHAPCGIVLMFCFFLAALWVDRQTRR